MVCSARGQRQLRPATPAVSLDRSLNLASVPVVSDRAFDGSTYLFSMTLPERTGKQFSKIAFLYDRSQAKTMPIFDLSTKVFMGTLTVEQRSG